MALDRIPGQFNVYIGGFISLRRKDALKRANITHIVSVVDWTIDADLIQGYEHFSIPVQDVDDEKLINHFNDANHFIQQGLDQGGSVLVHCAMGKSRSATICIAFLLWKSSHSASDERLDPDSALALIRVPRPLCEPNKGFMQQLWLYYEMGCPDDLDNDPRYERWLYKQTLQESLEIGRAPDVSDVFFEDERAKCPSEVTNEAPKETDIKCRKCRRSLAHSGFVVDHSPPNPGVQCGHIYLQPVSWMRGSLQTGELEGRLVCPNHRCKTNIGKFAWQGQRCSCGQWITPAFSLIRGKVDEVSTSQREPQIRQPPTLSKTGNL